MDSLEILRAWQNGRWPIVAAYIIATLFGGTLLVCAAIVTVNSAAHIVLGTKETTITATTASSTSIVASSSVVASKISGTNVALYNTAPIASTSNPYSFKGQIMQVQER